MLRFMKPGDIFCFRLNNEKYCFGRIISKTSPGHAVEIFNFTSTTPNITENIISESKRIIPPVVIDSYGLFDKKVYPDSEWRMIGHQNNYIPKNIEDVYFTYGLGNSCKKVDIFGNESPISENEAWSYPRLSPHSDYHIKSLLKDVL